MKVWDKVMQTVQRAVLAVGAGLIASFAAWGQNATPQANGIEAIAVAGQQGGNIVVKITLRPQDSRSTTRRASRSIFRIPTTHWAKPRRKSATASCAT